MKFALAGNPNSGKTTLFNVLTGSTAHVGNWPGVTVDKKVGRYKKLEEAIDIVDLPGIYSLSPYTPEEVISRNFVLDEKPDCIINIVDATNLERNLYLTTQLLELDIPIVIALNMIDVVGKLGDIIDVKTLEKKLGVPVVAISALRNEGVKELMEAAFKVSKTYREGICVLENSSYKDIYSKIHKLYKDVKVDNAIFHAVKMLENDEIEIKNYPQIAKQTTELKTGINTGVFEGDFEGVVADQRYKFISVNLHGLLKLSKREGMSKSDKIDRVLTHRIWGIPLFLLIIFAVFHLTFSENLLFIGYLIPEGSFDIPIIGTDAINSPGVILFNCMEWLTGTIGDAIGGAMPAGAWYTSLICDGLLAGIFAVLSFIPQIMCLFFFLSILEDSGYMARVAFIMDRAFRKLGLSGKAFMPLIMCFGCAVPGIMATRTLEDDAERRRTIMLTPFFSCGAKLPIWAAFAGVFATAYSALNAEVIVYSMYILGIAIAILAAFILKKTAVKGETPPFIMELPAYHMPKAKNVGIHLWEKLKHYLFRAATIIAGAIVIIWFLSTFSFSFRMVEDSGDSILGIIGKGLSWLFIPLGFGMGENGWKFVVAAITGLIAKEMVVATMGTFAGLDGDEAMEMEGGDIAGTALGTMMLGIGGVLGGINISIPAMFAFMAFNLLSVPCMAAVAAASAELRSKKWVFFSIGFWLLTAYGVSLLVFWLGVFFAVNWLAATLTMIGIIGIAIAFIILNQKGKLDFLKRKVKKKTENLSA